ncbi:hypothetical protein BFG60_0505 [Microcystis aeruginosa NIES-98]|nr:hypothetical protein BFG60_0505 [Microcystis aeruginosa NIES-98]
MNNRELTDGDYFEERSGKVGLRENNHQINKPNIIQRISLTRRIFKNCAF